MASEVLVDGEPCGAIPADDRGLAYGDGIFRTVRIARGRPLAWDEHQARLAHDCAALSLPAPDRNVLERDLRALFPNEQDGILKIIISRGSGGRGYAPPHDSARRIVSAHALPAHAHGEPAALTLRRSPIALACQPRLAGVKHLNRLEQVLARAACDERGDADAWMADSEGFVVATTMRNLFFVDANDAWHTPAITRAGIIGATRQRLIRALGRSGITLHERDIRPDELGQFGAALACNSVGGVAPVNALDGRALTYSERAAVWARGIIE